MLGFDAKKVGVDEVKNALAMNLAFCNNLHTCI